MWVKSVISDKNIPFSFIDSSGHLFQGVRKIFGAKKESIYSLRTPMDAIYLSWYIGTLIRDDLKKLKLMATDTSVLKRIENTKKWVRKKAVLHSHAVHLEGNWIAQHPLFQQLAKDVGFSENDVKFKLQMITILHDIGRLCEVDIQSGCKFDLPNILGKGHDHAIESYEMLRRFGISDLIILLPIKYHGLLDFEETLQSDTEFCSLSQKQKEQVILLLYAVRDADMGANMFAYGRAGSKGCGERNDPRFKQTGACYITPICLEDIYLKRKAQTCNAKTFLDIQLRWIGWGFQLHFPFYKERVAQTSVSDMFERIFEEASDQFNGVSERINRTQYAQTLRQLRGAKKFVMQELNPVCKKKLIMSEPVMKQLENNYQKGRECQ